MSETAEAIDLAHLQTWIGRTEEADDIVTPRLVAEFRATFEPNLAPVSMMEAPLMLQWCLTPPIAPMSQLTDEGHLRKGGFLPPVPLPRRMWAGGVVETLGALRIGDIVRRVSRVENVALKEGRTGRLCFVTVRHEYFAGAQVALKERHDIVYRDAPDPAAPPPAMKRTELASELTWDVDPTEAMLFRYSALMFNAHRIHYDLRYVTEVEGYAGLVVHGPLQGSLLFNIASVLGGSAPKAFDYRGLSPLIAGDPFRVHAAQDGKTVRCWTEDSTGATCMEGEATW